MNTPSTNVLADSDYGAIEDALQATAKGRRFLRAYIERNRSLESRRLLQSISRLHRAALGEPGLNAEICRDLSTVLRSVNRHRQAALKCNDPSARLGAFERGLEEVESCLISLIETIEDKAFESLGSRTIGSPFDDVEELFPGGRTAQLFGELSSYLSDDPR
jgi:hypothetical protein